MDKILIHYALQTCDVKNYSVNNRFCTDNRTELSKKSLTSFLQAIKYLCYKKPETMNCIRIFQDSCTDELKDYISYLIHQYYSNNIIIDTTSVDRPGIASSIKNCYDWLINNGSNLVYQIQDDYIFTKKSLFYSIEMFYHLYYKYKTHPIICPYIDPDFIRMYEGKSIPRLLELGLHSYWLQVYDTSCTFLTSHRQFIQHQDLYNVFYDLVEKRIIEDNKIILENRSLNYMFTQRGVLGVTPITGLTFHMQGPAEKDPYIDWKPLWESININYRL